MSNSNVSPTIKKVSWGQVELTDGNTYRDAMLYPGGCQPWDWNKSGTHHKPGILPQDVQYLLEHGAEAIVLSRGKHNRLQTAEATIKLLENKSIPYYQLQTDKAVKKYNSLAKNKQVGALIHSTC